MDPLNEVFSARRAAAKARLRQAVALDVAFVLNAEVEARLRSRPHFLASTPKIALVALRGRLDEAGAALVTQLMEKLEALEDWFGGEPIDENEEVPALSGVLAAIPAEVHRILARYGVPGDARPDEPDDTALDLEPDYALRYEPSPATLWAWRQLRGLDAARHELEGDAHADGFEVRFHLPEALSE